MAFDAMAIANYFLDCAGREEKQIDPLKLQKLVYFAHGWHLALLGQPLIQDRVEAWAYGPVIRSLYDEFKRFGNGPIDARAKKVEIQRSAAGMRIVSRVPTIDDCEDQSAIERTRGILDRVWQVYGKFSGIQLSNMTHEISGAWQKARLAFPGACDTVIDDAAIKDEFEAKRSASIPMQYSLAGAQA